MVTHNSPRSHIPGHMTRYCVEYLWETCGIMLDIVGYLQAFGLAPYNSKGVEIS